MPHSSPDALQFCEDSEIGSEASYPRFGLHPYWPGGGSGVTWGIGFDAGYEPRAQVIADWAELPMDTLARLLGAVGIHGAAAAPIAEELGDLSIPLDIARRVFVDMNVPRYEALVLTAFPNAVELPGDCFGALFDLVFNRGASVTDLPQDLQHRRREMRQIQQLANTRWWNQVPDLIRSMKRLWDPAHFPGLHRRRDGEAEMFIRGLQGWENPPYGALWPAA